MEAGLQFQPKESDIFITTYPKCGTTWVSFIAHSLRSRGNIDFDEITSVVPWTIYAQDCNQDLDAEHEFNPRLFKSHESYDIVPKGGKYIYVSRHPHDVCVSMYQFLLDFVQVDNSEVSLEEFAEKIFVGHGTKSGKIWRHFLSFYPHRNDDNVLWLCYEDLTANTERCVERIAEFMGIELDDELREIVMRQSSFAFMKEHQSLFDDHLVFDSCKVRMGLPPDTKVLASKVNKGKAGARVSLTDEIRAMLDQQWDEVIRTETGLPDYDSLRREVAQPI
eukprot:CAMPEP_0185030560 /NCGR_PEP_ID=MMETSP1103-20130426/17546_1 /TAXON_ID=36769 /ORGANISM="Paraphysomonas bandaiensis, Strain Caron Lab Isolate" /LENGTH=277 /DNA_ID=CAMNT_0027565743 /DNA_START=88 /DNA_END=921 /DNA_ORIENTATION=-